MTATRATDRITGSALSRPQATTATRARRSAGLRAAAGPGSSTVCDERCYGRLANDVMLAVRRLTAADIPGRATSPVK